MLFMVIENFTHGISIVGERFREKGCMLPEGVIYYASWIESTGSRCYQIMEAPSPESLRVWTAR